MQAVAITQITPPELETLIETSLKKIISGLSLSPTKAKADEFLTIQQAAGFLKLSVATLYGLVSRAAIPVNKKGKRLCFSKQKSTARVKKDCKQAKRKNQPPTKTTFCSKQICSVKKTSIKNDRSSLIVYKRGKVEVTGDANSIETLIWTDSIFYWLRILFVFVLVFIVPQAHFLSLVWQWFKRGYK